MNGKVAILGKQQPAYMRANMKKLLEDRGHTADILDMETRCAADWIDALKGYDALITAGEKFPGVVFDGLAGSLRVLSRYGVGTDEIDKERAAAHGIAVCNAAGTLSTAVAECCMGLILCLLRRLPDGDKEVRANDWSRFFESKTGTQIEGKTVGLIGFGDIAKALAKMLSGFGCRVIAYDIYFDKETADRWNVEFADIETIRRESDIISLHVPSTLETQGMIDMEFMKGMKPTAILINTGRGALIVEEDLANALRDRVIAAAGLDVFTKEPPEPDNPLLTLPNVMLLPHCGAGTKECLEKAGYMAAENAADFLEGKPVRTILNKDYINHEV
ncbi:MAG: hypothetical protein E7638_03565 [Ruminococcaceae bacterium]|nr:hypothetical protein [Oscillospiraceae bacterium]